LPTRSRYSRWMTLDCRRYRLLALYIDLRVTAKGGGGGRRRRRRRKKKKKRRFIYRTKVQGCAENLYYIFGKFCSFLVFIAIRFNTKRSTSGQILIKQIKGYTIATAQPFMCFNNCLV